jgi:hypothetical protein
MTDVAIDNGDAVITKGCGVLAENAKVGEDDDQLDSFRWKLVE